MKYIYSRLAIAFEWFLLIGLVALMLLLKYIRDGDITFTRKMIITLYGFLITCWSLWGKEYLNRFVEFHDEYVCFNSFRFGKTVRDLNVRYEDILSLEAKVFPLVGIYRVRVRCKNVPWQIPVIFFMKKHNELFARLYSTAKAHNPGVYFDQKAIQILERKGYLKNDQAS